MSKIEINEEDNHILRVRDCKEGDFVILKEGDYSGQICYIYKNFNLPFNTSMVALGKPRTGWDNASKCSLKCHYFEGTIKVSK